MTEWQSIETAPKDGTSIWLINECMDDPVRGRWGDIFVDWREKPYLGWVSEYTDDEFFPFPAGRMICPDRWKPTEQSDG